MNLDGFMGWLSRVNVPLLIAVAASFALIVLWKYDYTTPWIEGCLIGSTVTGFAGYYGSRKGRRPRK